LATELDIPVVVSYQLNRDAAKKIKKQKSDEVDLEDIGYSDAIGQLSSIVLALLEEESVETLLARKVTVLKGRYGETGSFRVNWDFQKMDFKQIIEGTKELAYL
jgi:replicative DNA helicase